MPEEKHRAETGTRLEIVRSARRLHHCTGDRNTKTYQCAVGKYATPTPLGSYSVVNKVVNPGGMLGTRWMGLNIPDGNYGIHGTNNPASIGQFISNGCIRMYNSDVEELFPKINIGTPVIITDQDGGSPQQGGGSPQQAEGGRKHMVRPGDTLWNISRIYGVTVDAIVRANNLPDPDLLIPGQVLIIP